MTEEKAFKIIDDNILLFISGNGLNKQVEVKKIPHSDWLVFKWRQLIWEKKGVTNILEIFSSFDNHEKLQVGTFMQRPHLIEAVKNITGSGHWPEISHLKM